MIINKRLAYFRTVIVVHIHENVFDHAHRSLVLFPVLCYFDKHILVLSIYQLLEYLVDYLADGCAHILVQKFSFFVLYDVVPVSIELLVG